MKLIIAITAASLSTGSLAFAPMGASRSVATALNANKVGIYYSTMTGNTETIAGYIAEAAGISGMNDVGDVPDAEVVGLDSIIVGAPTWHTDSDSERSGTAWDNWLYKTLVHLDRWL
jgi:hypothetical protein